MRDGWIEAAVLEHLRSAGEDWAPVVGAGFPLGSSSLRADLAILADEFIGVLVRGADEPMSRLIGELGVYSCYFDHVVLAVAPSHLATLDPNLLGSATVWAIEEDGRVVEHRAGDANAVGVYAFFDLLPAAERRRLLRPLIADAPAHARGDAPIAFEQVRERFGELFTTRHLDRSVAFWAAVSGRRITPDDVARLREESTPRYIASGAA